MRIILNEIYGTRPVHIISAGNVDDATRLLSAVTVVISATNVFNEETFLDGGVFLRRKYRRVSIELNRAAPFIII